MHILSKEIDKMSGQQLLELIAKYPDEPEIFARIGRIVLYHECLKSGPATSNTLTALTLNVEGGPVNFDILRLAMITAVLYRMSFEETMDDAFEVMQKSVDPNSHTPSEIVREYAPYGWHYVRDHIIALDHNAELPENPPDLVGA